MRAVLAATALVASAAQQAPWKPCGGGGTPVCCDPNTDSAHKFCPGNVQCGNCGAAPEGRLQKCACPGIYEWHDGQLFWADSSPPPPPPPPPQAAAPVPAAAPPPEAAATPDGFPKVHLLLLTEAGCPPCQRAIAGPLSDLIHTPGIADILEVENHPFGNNYYSTTECGGAPYDSVARHCWAHSCIETNSLPDCFTGDIVTQHGAMEGAVNRMLACAKAHSAGWQAYWPFISCMERDYLEKGGLPAAEGCAAEAQLNFGELDDCYMGSEGDTLMVEAAKATVDHEATPTVKVNGKEIQPVDVLREVCLAYTGPRPSACLTFTQRRLQEERAAPAVQV